MRHNFVYNGLPHTCDLCRITPREFEKFLLTNILTYVPLKKIFKLNDEVIAESVTLQQKPEETKGFYKITSSIIQIENILGIDFEIGDRVYYDFSTQNLSKARTEYCVGQVYEVLQGYLKVLHPWPPVVKYTSP